jgi:hypothetical protein
MGTEPLTPARVAIACAQCARTVHATPRKDGAAKLPRAWKRHADRVWCDQCWRAHFVLRAITIPVAGPVDADWPALRAALRGAWRDAARVANWAVRQLAQADVVHTPELDRLPPMPRVYLYPGARRIAPTLDPSSIVALLQAVERRYRARRSHVVWRMAESLPSYRYPTPYPVHNQSWSVACEEGGALLLSVRLAGTRWTLRLRGGARYGRQLGAVRRLVAGEAVQGELALYERGREVLAKMVVWLPRHGRREQGRSGTLYVRTGADHLWTYHVDDGEPRYLHADHVRRWIASYDRRMRRLADDTKAEKRPTRRHGRGIEEVRAAWVRRQQARLDSWAHEVTAMLARYADRQRVARVVYDDRDTSYLPHAPWQLLR